MIHHPPPLSIALQTLRLQNDFPSGRMVSTHSSVSWRGNISPDQYGRIYDVELIYKKGTVPQVWVRNPNLTELSHGRRLPHVYNQATQQLCLYLPGCGLWTSNKPLSTTVMLWTHLWLWFFEIWLVTDIFHGRGEHPIPKKKKNKPSEIVVS